MPHSYGYRARTRSMFSRKFGEHGVNHLSTYLRNYKVRVFTMCVCACREAWSGGGVGAGLLRCACRDGSGQPARSPNNKPKPCIY